MNIDGFEEKIANKAFQKRFLQKAELILARKEYQEEIKNIREVCGIPEDGFKYDDFDNYYKWLEKQFNDKFKSVSIVIESSKLIKCKPRHFLNKALFTIETDDLYNYPDSLYFSEDEEFFYDLIHEEPFPGIFNYILLNNILVPETNGLMLSFSKKYNFPTLTFGPNATKRDVDSCIGLINFFQRSSKNGMHEYKKNKSRLKKNHLIIHDMVTNPEKENYEVMEDHNISTRREDSKNGLERMRQIRKRSQN